MSSCPRSPAPAFPHVSLPAGRPSAVPASVPATGTVPHFPPLRIRGGRYRPGWSARRRRRAVAAGLAMTAAALAASGLRGSASPVAAPAAAPRPLVARPLVSAPVRIADPETVRLLKPGDRVDVIAAPAPAGLSAGDGPAARVVASAARVSRVPDAAPGTGHSEGGALVVLSVPRATAAELAAASATSRLAVTLC
ncbi:RcpC/CpaB family pilus assembly protein [Streptomyces sp. CC77]|uniref:RcpC/CpaB family pilus assembly protein n=1 Tax=Streptomyces sp. CC77 TaxID=1906739 RepID=UPI0008DE7258|nr:RcpC/CpaB family pilus assembly protein [Streptomyces sp. CC77]OII69283.1 hypothetical protein BJP39_17970 [Streptomyces sp. CC77]